MGVLAPHPGGRGRPLLAGLVALAVVLLGAAPAAAETGLLAHWAMDVDNVDQDLHSTPEASNPALTASGFNAAVVAVGQGKFGNAIDMPLLGNAGSHWEVLPNGILAPPQLTLSAWVKHTGSSGTFKWIISKGAEGCNGSTYGFSTGGDGGVHFVVRDALTFHVVDISGPALWDGQWHAIGGSYDGANLRGYLDGALTGTVPQSAPLAYALPTSQKLVFGAYAGASCAPSFDYTFPGLIDEVKLYDRALTQPQITFIQNPAATTPPNVDNAPPSTPPAPVITSLKLASTIVRNKPIVMAAASAGTTDHFEWNLGGDARPEVVGLNGQTALAWRPPGGPTTIGVRAVGPGGISPYVVTTVTTPPLGGDPDLVKLLPAAQKLGPVYATGPQDQLIAATDSALKNACALVNSTVHYQGTQYTGCLRPIRALTDLPPKERGILQELARLRIRPQKFDLNGAVAWYLGPGLDLLAGYIAEGPVRYNGVTIDPRPGAAVAVYPSGALIASSNAGMFLDGIKMQARPDFVLDTVPGGGGIPLGTFPVDLSGIRRVAGFELGTDIRVTVLPGTAANPPGVQIVANLKLPTWLTVGGVRAQGQVVIRALTDGKLILDKLRIGPIDADIADALNLEALQLDYTRATNEWHGQGKACVLGGTCLNMIPDKGQVVVQNDALKLAGATLQFPAPGIPLFPGLNMEEIGFTVGLDPTLFAGNAKVVGAKIYDINGKVLLVFPSPAAPYVFSAATAGGGFPASFYGRVHTQPTVALSANAALRVPLIGSIPMGNGYFVYEYPGYIGFGGGVDQDFFDIISLTGRVDGELNASNGRFYVLGRVSTCVIGICRSATGIVSSRGVGGCIGLGPVSIGGGVIYSPFEILLWPLDGCKWSPFRPPNVRSTGLGGSHPSRLAVPGEHLVTIGSDRASRAIRLEGTTEAPRVRVSGPGGLVLDSTVATGLATIGPIRIMRSVENKLTVIGLQDPRAGDYRITPLTGAPAAREVTEATDLPAARVTGRVSGAGVRKTLRYDIRRRAGQRVTFVELGPSGGRQIGVINGGGKGSLRFTTTPGVGTRTIEARFELSGLPAERKRVARFRAPSAKLATPRGLKVTHRGSTLRVRFRAVKGATRYVVVVTNAAGKQRTVRTRSRSLVIRSIPASDAGRVTVKAIANLQASRAAGANFKRTKARPTRVSKLPVIRR